MHFEWDPGKARSNLAKHGVSFETATLVFDDECSMDTLDDNDDELRFRIIGRAEADILVVIYTERGDRTRLISARKAEKHEREAYRLQAI